MTETEALRIFKSIRLYFKGTYDIDKYGLDHIKISEKEYHKHQYFLQKAKKQFTKKDFIEFVVANTLGNTNYGDIVTIDQHSFSTYKSWKKKQDRFTFEFESDIIAIRDEFLIPQHLQFNDLFNTTKGHPLILKMLLGGDINLETFIAMNDVLNFFPHFNHEMKNDYIWEETRDKSLRYKRFLNYDNDKIKEILKNAYTTK